MPFVLLACIGLCRLFHDDPATSARFSHLDPRDRSHAPPCQSSSRPVRVGGVGRPSDEAFIRYSPRHASASPGRHRRRRLRRPAVREGAARASRSTSLLVDRQNYHLFTPLLYQVASCLLNPSEITAPLRKVLRGAPNVRYRQGEVVDVDFARQARAARRRRERSSTTTLVLATGSVTNYYGNERDRDARARAEGSRRGAAAPQPRARVPRTRDARRPMPTSAGGCSRSASSAADRPAWSTRARSPSSRGSCCRTSTRSSRRPSVRIVLLEGGDRVLPMFAPRLVAYARRELERRGVDVRTEHARRVGRRDGRRAARRHRAADRDDGVDRGRATRGRPRASRRDAHRAAALRGRRPPPRARRRARVRDRRRRGRARHARPGRCRCCRRPRCRPAATSPATSCAAAAAARFRYHDKGTLATIGRRAAVGQIGPDPLTRLPRLGRLARRAPLLPDRLREPAPGAAALGLVLRAPRPARPVDPAGRPAAAGEPEREPVGNGRRRPSLYEVPPDGTQGRHHGNRRDHQRQLRRDDHRQRHRARSTSGPTWCGPCRQFGPVFEQASAENADLVFGKVDTEDAARAGRRRSTSCRSRR